MLEILTAIVPLAVIVPPDSPVPAVTDVTVPTLKAAQDGTPAEFSVSAKVPLLLPGNVTHKEPFQYTRSPGRTGAGKTAVAAPGCVVAPVPPREIPSAAVHAPNKPV